MGWTDVCKRGVPSGGKVREDDPKGKSPLLHDAGGPSPGIQKFIREVIRATPLVNTPVKPADFPTWANIQAYPGRGGVDPHFEGRAVDVFINARVPNEKVWGDWLFDWCMTNCTIYKIQGVIFDTRKWFSEMNGGVEFVYGGGDHWNHVHVELNCDGAALTTVPPSPPAGLVGTWDATIGTWNGIFIFTADRLVGWANDDRSHKTWGDWSEDGGNVFFQFRDPGDFRVFKVPLPVLPAKSSGTIIPAGQGWFTMTRRS